MVHPENNNIGWKKASSSTNWRTQTAPNGRACSVSPLTIPKLFDPPFKPKRSSGWFVSLTVTNVPFGRTRSKEMTLSTPSPYWFANQLYPPKRIKPTPENNQDRDAFGQRKRLTNAGHSATCDRNIVLFKNRVYLVPGTTTSNIYRPSCFVVDD